MRAYLNLCQMAPTRRGLFRRFIHSVKLYSLHNSTAQEEPNVQHCQRQVTPIGTGHATVHPDGQQSQACAIGLKNPTKPLSRPRSLRTNTDPTIRASAAHHRARRRQGRPGKSWWRSISIHTAALSSRSSSICPPGQMPSTAAPSGDGPRFSRCRPVQMYLIVDKEPEGDHTYSKRASTWKAG